MPSTLPNAVIIIPARMASTRLPGKPLADIGGEPMIVQVWRRAMEAGVGPVFVACDDVRVEQAVKRAGGSAVMTRADHPSGSDRIFEALGKIDPAGAHDIIINLQGDMPTLDPKLVNAVLAPLAEPDVDIATLATEIDNEADKGNAAVVKVVVSGRWSVVSEEKNTDHWPLTTDHCKALYFSRATIPSGEGPHFHHIGIYAYRRAALEKFVTLPPSPLELREKLEQLRALEAGMRIGVSVVHTVPLGVDTQEQLEEARKILRG